MDGDSCNVTSCMRLCVQVTETRLSEVMCPTPRTCTSTIKAVDAMLVSGIQLLSHLPLCTSFGLWSAWALLLDKDEELVGIIS